MSQGPADSISVGQHALQDKTSLHDEKWNGTEAEELSCYVTEVSPWPCLDDT